MGDSRSLFRLFAALLVLIIVLFGWAPLNGASDFWAHAAVGRWILQHHRVPDHALFEWADQSSWICHSWGTEVLFYLFIQAAGPLGGAALGIFSGSVLSAMGILTWTRLWWQKGANPLLIAGVVSLLVYFAHSRFLARPESFSFVFLSFLLLICSRIACAEIHDKRTRAKWCAGLGILFLLWANLHGLVFIGLALLWLTVACLALASVWLPEQRASAITLALGALLGTLATLLNPAGIRLWSVLIFAKPPDVGGPTIDEFLSPLSKQSSYHKADLVVAALLLLFALWTWSTSRPKQLYTLAWLVFGILLFLSGARHVATFALITLVVTTLGARSSAEETTPQPPGVWHWASLALLLAVLCLQGPRVNSQIIAEETPLRMADFLRGCPFSGNLVNSYNCSSYLTWGTASARPLFIHSLNGSPELARLYGVVMSQGPEGQTFLDTNPIGAVAVETPVSSRGDCYPPLATRLAYHPKHWALVYAARDGAVWVRRSAVPAGYLQQHEKQVDPEVFLPHLPVGDPLATVPPRQWLPPGIVDGK